MESIIQSMAGVLCCHLDCKLTLDKSQTNISSIVGYTAEELEANFQNQLLALILEDERDFVFQEINEQLYSCDDIEITFQVQHKNGKVICILSKLRKVVSDDNTVYLYGICTDITKTKELQMITKKNLQQYKIILAQTENIIFEYDIMSDNLFLSDTWYTIFGYQPSTHNFLKTLTLHSHIHKEDIRLLFERFRILQKGGGYQTLEIRIGRLNGSYIWCKIRATGIYDENGKLCKIIGIIINIDDEKRVTVALQKKAECDALTKLFNNSSARKHCQEYLDTLHHNIHCALMIIDLDNFKYVNDHFGHMYGDQVLVQAANGLKNLFRSKDVVARIGGDEFLVMMKDVSDYLLVEKRCHQIIQTINSIFKEQPLLKDFSCSIGVAFSPIHGTTYRELFNRADEALYNAKDMGKGRYSIYKK